MEKVCALLSDDVYPENDLKQLPPGWVLMKKWVEPSNLVAALYYNQSTNQDVLAFKGTEPTSSDDWKANIAQVAQGAALGLPNTKQYKDALAITKVVLDRQNGQMFNDATLTLTGHSLGGGLASYVALSKELPAYVFNAAALSRKTIMGPPWLFPDKAEQPGNGKEIYQYYIVGELLT
jgi:hypothetical protein